MSVIGRVKEVPENAKKTFSDLRGKSVTDALANSGRRFGSANRRMVKGLGGGLKRLRRKK